MSFDHWWFATLLDRDDHARLAPLFAAAADEAVLSAEAQAAIAAWRATPAAFARAAARGADPRAVNAFIWAFNLPGFDELAEDLVTDDALRGDLMDDAKLFRFAILPRNTPVSVVWHALGDARAQRLPGTMGNLLLAPHEVPAALAAVESAYAGLSERALVDAAAAYCAGDVPDRQVLRDVVALLPEGLAEAAARGTGFLALARAQV